jgi:transcriptional regulator with XRE-family HTH domain
MKQKESGIIANIVEIRKLRGINKREMAGLLNINEASYGRFEGGEVALTYNRLAEIASVFNMHPIDLITYPDVWRKVEQSEQPKAEPVEAVLQIRLQKEKKDQVLKLIFGENNIEILNK